MNPASLWRYSFAQRIAPIYAANPHVTAVILGGSVARGHADRYSDIELGVFWGKPPTDKDRQTAADAFPGDLIRLYPYDAVEEVWSDDFILGRAHPDQPRSGVLVEVVHYTTDTLLRTFDAVLKDYNPDPLKQNLIAGVVDSIPLYQAELVNEWKTRASDYPKGLAVAVVMRYSQIDHFWRWQMWIARRNNLMMLYASFAQAQQQLLHVLLGLNHVYYFGFKWLDAINERLIHKPAELLSRLGQIYQVDPAFGAHELAALIEETYDLIEELMPQIDVVWLRTVFRYQRPAWDQEPPYV